MEAVLNLELVLPHFGTKTFLCAPLGALGIVVPSSVSGLGAVTSDLSRWFLWPWAVSSRVCTDQHSTEYSGAGVGKTERRFRSLKHCCIDTLPQKHPGRLLTLQIGGPWSRPIRSRNEINTSQKEKWNSEVISAIVVWERGEEIAKKGWSSCRLEKG